MRKRVLNRVGLLIAAALLACALCGCANSGKKKAAVDATTESDGTQDAPSQDASPQDSKDTSQTAIQLKLGDTVVPVKWEDNDSVRELREMAAQEPLVIQMSMYDDFEQVGPIGREVTSSDVQMTTEPGDMVLYSGDQIVVFYGSNSWAYTKLGNIELTEDEMTDLLGHGDIELTLSCN